MKITLGKNKRAKWVKSELEWTGEEVSAAAAWESLRFWQAAAAAAAAAAAVGPAQAPEGRRKEHQLPSRGS